MGGEVETVVTAEVDVYCPFEKENASKAPEESAGNVKDGFLLGILQKFQTHVTLILRMRFKHVHTCV